MNIINPDYDWAYSFKKRDTTTHLIIHHAAGDGSPEAIHEYHKKIGYAGIAYHFYVRKDGTVYAGRPIDKQGGHTTNWNWCSIGICFEGNFDNEKMSAAQIKAGRELVEFVRGLYPGIAVGPHKNFQSTACPGANFPYDEIVAGNKPGDEPANTDVEASAEPSKWAAKSCKKAIDKEVFVGGDKGYDWQRPITREELCVVLDRLGMLPDDALKEAATPGLEYGA